MTEKDKVINEYFEWIFEVTCGKRYAKLISYRKLLMYLHDREFVYSIPRDGNRADDGINLRRRFALAHGYDDDITYYLHGPCSVLEMMVALAKRCEESLMDNAERGDRTGQWFWGMISNLGLGSMTDDEFDKGYVEEVINIFLNREYEPDGKGGLFTVKHCEYDLRTIEIWIQLCWYLDALDGIA